MSNAKERIVVSEQSSIKGLARKLAAIRAGLEPLGEKKGKVTQGGTYEYHRAEDVQAHVRAALIEQNVLLVPKVCDCTHDPFDTDNGKTRFLTTVRGECEVIDADSGESMTIPMVGAGTDNGEKGVYKAMTGAWKYLVMYLFQLAATDDPEAEDGGQQTRARATTKRRAVSKPKAQEFASATAVKNLKAAAHLADFDAERWQTMLTALGVEDEAKFPTEKLAEARQQVFEAGAQVA
jgi:hypothetical protein